MFGVFRVVDVDLHLAREKLRKAGIREAQNEASAPNELHEVVNEAQVGGLNRANSDFLPCAALRATVRFAAAGVSWLRPYRVDHLNACEIFLIIRDDNAAICLGDGCDDCIERTSWPAASPSAMSLAQARPAFSSNGKTRPANSACGPSGPSNQALSSARCLPIGFYRQKAPERAGLAFLSSGEPVRRQTVSAIYWRWAKLISLAPARVGRRWAGLKRVAMGKRVSALDHCRMCLAYQPGQPQCRRSSSPSGSARRLARLLRSCA